MTDATNRRPSASGYTAGIVRELEALDLVCAALEPDDLAGRMYDLSNDGDDLDELRERLEDEQPDDSDMVAAALSWIVETADDLAEWDGRAALAYVQTAILEVVEYGHRSAYSETAPYGWTVDRVELLRTVGGPDARISIDADDPDRVTVRTTWGGHTHTRRLVLPAAGPALFDETPAGIE